VDKGRKHSEQVPVGIQAPTLVYSTDIDLNKFDQKAARLD